MHLRVVRYILWTAQIYLTKKGENMKRLRLLIAVIISLTIFLTPASTVLAGDDVDVELGTYMNFEELDDTIIYPADGWNVIPIIEDGLLAGWEVVGRQARGTVSGTISTENISGIFTFTYNAILDLNQQGTMEATLVMDLDDGVISGEFEGGTAVVGGEFVPGQGGYLLMVFYSTKFKLEGNTAYYSDIVGDGSLSNWDSPVCVYLDPEGHVYDVIGGVDLQVECLAKLE